MESGLLNAFSDDHYDGTNYPMFDNYTNSSWLAEAENLGLQQSDTLNEIMLPNAISTENQTSPITDYIQEENEAIANDYSRVQKILEEGDCAVEVIPVDPNREFSSPLDDYIDNDDLIVSQSISIDEDFELSSSIGDYESHTSDVNSVKSSPAYISKLAAFDNLENELQNFDMPFMSTEPEIDLQNFNLAAFIDKDDVLLSAKQKNFSTPAEKQIVSKGKNKIMNPEIYYFPSDSDGSIDIETLDSPRPVIVESGASGHVTALYHPETFETSTIVIEDDTIRDPSWLPNSTKAKSTKTTRRGRPPLNPQNGNVVKKSDVKEPPKIAQDKNNIRSVITKRFPVTFLNSNKGMSKIHQKIGRTTSGCAINEIQKNYKEKIDCTQQNKTQKMDKISQSNEREKIVTSVEEIESIDTEKMSPIKKRLHLDEYKKRRSGGGDRPSLSATIVGISASKSSSNAPIQPRPIKPQDTNRLTGKIIAPTKLLYERKDFDPLAEVRKKVLRMREMKRAAQTKLIDLRVSARVGPVTKILPLEEITAKATDKQTVQDLEIEKPVRLHPDYEEIIIVSVGSNTDLRVPTDESHKLPKDVSQLRDNQIVANSLLSSIQDTVLKKDSSTLIYEGMASSVGKDFENSTAIKVHGEDKTIMHLHKDRARKTTQSIRTQTEYTPLFLPLKFLLSNIQRSAENENFEKKNRPVNQLFKSFDSQKSCSISPDSHQSYGSGSHRHMNTKHKTHNRNSRSSSKRKHKPDVSSRSNSSSSGCSLSSISGVSSQFETERHDRCLEKKKRRYSASPSRGTSGSSQSRSISRSRSRGHQTPCSDRRSRSPRHAEISLAVDERRIVYVGRVERDTSMEDLKRKFQPYGPVKQITVHYKDNGLKYGFVTFRNAQNAYQAIDNGPNDPNINMYDISFGGRRAFCRQNYSDLDGAASNELESYPDSSVRPTPVAGTAIVGGKENAEDSFEALLRKVKKEISGAKSVNSNSQSHDKM